MSIAHQMTLAANQVTLAELKPEVKRQLWRGINRLDPDRANMMSALPKNPMVQELQQIFNATLVIDKKDFYKYMRAGA